MLTVLLFNPRSAKSKPRIPNSILQVAASIHSKHNYFIVDGNMETDPFEKIKDYFSKNKIDVFGCTVMPGPQLKQAVTVSKQIRSLFPATKIVWGGYFPSNQPQVTLESGFVDVVVNGMGDICFPQLLKAFETGGSLHDIPNIIYKKENALVNNIKDGIYDLNELPPLPYKELDRFYPVKNYLGKTYLGSETIAYHSSFGCPFTCSFCGIVPIYNGRWKARSAQGIYEDIKFIKNNYGGNAIEFHDNNFFVSEKRTVEFSQLIRTEDMTWWGEARIDTMDKYKDESLALIREAGCKMIFFGAETGNDAVLKQMDKGGTQTGEQVLKFAERIAKFDIIPEYSFVLGLPGKSEEAVNRQIDEDIAFIKKIKGANPRTEIIIYVYSPVPTEKSELYKQIVSSGFTFPKVLEDWISPVWENFDLRKNPLTPWLKPYMIDKIRNFETVLNGYFPTVSDIRFTPYKKKILKLYSAPRYKTGFYDFPIGIKALQKMWRYRQPEIEGF
ncbi:MAG: B12-binding domain-containing radical SAM protein [Bacteroidetes bacterium]|nr:B12-binding domain-containing radical SAM protein [Bacteroidota bacterium]